ncbi:MAG: hypothetical protein SNJ73_01585, partial [Acetobacteraceae bacterium]
MAGVAVLDDDQRVALSFADWSALSGACERIAVDRPLGTGDEAAAAPAPSEVICRMRERTAVTASLLERLGKPRRIVAGLDVPDVEPPPDHPLRALDNEVLSPPLGLFS